MRRRYRLAIQKAQRRAYSAGMGATVLQIGALGLATRQLDTSGRPRAPYDATAIATAAAERMLQRATDLVKRGTPEREAFGKALRKAGIGEAQRIATTETAGAFAYGQIDMLAQAEALHPREGYALAKTWNAYLDACPTCFGSDGDTVFLDETFPGGTPGLVHVNCACYTDVSLIPADTQTPTKR